MKTVYKERMKKDFPKNELKPFFALKKLKKSGEYLPLGFFENGELSAYAFFVVPKCTKTALFDYFAVRKDLRGKGTGGKCMSFFPDYLKDREIVLFECDHPDFASGEEKTKREHRIGFYARNGVKTSNVHANLFNADFLIMYMSEKDFTDGEIRKYLNEMYAFTFPKYIIGKKVTVY